MAVTYAVYYTLKMQARRHIIKVVCLIEHTCFFAYAFRMKQLMNKKCPPKPVQQIQEHGLVWQKKLYLLLLRPEQRMGSYNYVKK